MLIIRSVASVSLLNNFAIYIYIYTCISFTLILIRIISEDPVNSMNPLP